MQKYIYFLFKSKARCWVSTRDFLMEPVFLLVEQGREDAVFAPNYFFRVLDESHEHDDETIQNKMCDEEDSDSEGRSIDYGDSEESDKETQTTSVFDYEEEEFIQGPSYLSFLEEISAHQDFPEDCPEQRNAQEVSRLRALLDLCIVSLPEEEVKVEEDYITSLKFNSGDKAIVVSSKRDKTIIKYSQNPMHISTVQEILNSGNCRNPCDNNPMCAFTLVTVK
jgi:hypothetical protein